MMESEIKEQADKWKGNFGKDYTDRNPQSIREMEDLYMRNFGVKRTELNGEFLKNIDKDAKILEVGCNVGTQLGILKSQGFNNLTGIEVQPYAVEKAKSLFPDINFLVGSGLNLPFEDNSFDLVFTSGVLIHINPKDLPKIISEIHRVSKKYIWGYEYFCENYEEIHYRDNRELAWKNDFLTVFLKIIPGLKLLKEKMLDYLDDDNVDQMYLLEKERD